MAMNGTDILIWIDGDMVGSQRGVTFDESTEEIDISAKDSRAKRVLAGRYSSSVSLEALYVPDDTAYVSLQSAMRNGTLVTVQRYEDSAWLESAEAIVTSLSQEGPDQDTATVSVELVIDGEWSAGT